MERTSAVNNIEPVKGALPSLPLDPAAFIARFEASGRAAGFRLERFGEIAGYPLIALTKRTPGLRPRIYLSAGIHGDEPAPPTALLEMLEAGVFDRRATWFICPMLNPTGLAAGTRENSAGIDLNRDYRDPKSAEVRAHLDWLRRQPNFNLTICVHEDWEAKGFYLYELNPYGCPSLAEAMISAVATVCPIDISELIDAAAAAKGVIRPQIDPPLSREKWPESVYLRASHHTGLHYTIETPSGFPLRQRVAALRKAIETAIVELPRTVLSA